MMWVIVPHQGCLEQCRRFVIVPDSGVQHLPQRHSAKPSVVAWVPWHKAPSMFQQLCFGLTDAGGTKVGVEWWP